MRRNLILLIAMLFTAASCVSISTQAKAYDKGPKKEQKSKEKDEADKAKDDEDDSDDDSADEKEESPGNNQSDDEDDEKESKKEDSDDEDSTKSDEKAKSKPVKKDPAKSKDVTEEKKEEKKSENKAPVIKRLIEVRLDQFVIPARAINIPLPGRTKEVRELLEQFTKWSKSDDVGAVLLNLDGLNLALPDIEELRAGAMEMRKAGKKIFAYLNSGDDMGYLLACAADEVAMAPSSSLAVPGVGRLFPFMRGYYQLQGIEFDVITAGKYKYPGFISSREPNKYFTEEFEEILDSWIGDYVNLIAEGRKLSKIKVRDAIDHCLFDAQEAKNRGLIDVIAYYEEYRDRVVRRTKFKKSLDGESDFSRITSLQDLLTTMSREVQKAQESYKAVGPKIAILHARGPIIDMSLGSGYSSSLIMRDDFVRTIEEIRKNKTIQGVVLRIDSPGGSGYASDVIWRKLRELDEQKPVVVSMGTVAGSGGYYIACPGRLIFAEPTTITGSIGVLYIGANQASAINRMDVNLVEMKRGERSLLGIGHRDMPPADREMLQKFLLDFYEIFLDRVAVTRKMPKDEVRKIAEGRIYTGRQALAIGLVDRLGGIQDAIAAAREMANIPASAEIKVVHYPRPSTFGELAESLFGMSTLTNIATLAEMPAPSLSFDRQLQMFSQRPAPLCWMAMPDIRELLRPAAPADEMRQLLGLPAGLSPAAPKP